jgi:2-succinyl-5-enolpyruvyl-6-hydroxy-3-cyclohexene-1-carboxylate synthase
LAKMYQFEYYTANDEKSLQTNLKQFFKNNEKPAILEVFTPTKDNDKVLLQYFKQLE